MQPSQIGSELGVPGGRGQNSGSSTRFQTVRLLTLLNRASSLYASCDGHIVPPRSMFLLKIRAQITLRESCCPSRGDSFYKINTCTLAASVWSLRLVVSVQSQCDETEVSSSIVVFAVVVVVDD